MILPCACVIAIRRVPFPNKVPVSNNVVRLTIAWPGHFLLNVFRRLSQYNDNLETLCPLKGEKRMS